MRTTSTCRAARSVNPTSHSCWGPTQSAPSVTTRGCRQAWLLLQQHGTGAGTRTGNVCNTCEASGRRGQNRSSTCLGTLNQTHVHAQHVHAISTAGQLATWVIQTRPKECRGSWKAGPPTRYVISHWLSREKNEEIPGAAVLPCCLAALYGGVLPCCHTVFWRRV